MKTVCDVNPVSNPLPFIARLLIKVQALFPSFKANKKVKSQSKGSENNTIYFIETRQIGFEQESGKYGNATKKGRTLNKIRSNITLPLCALNKLLKTQASEISP